jgi:hypothetical protein
MNQINEKITFTFDDKTYFRLGTDLYDNELAILPNGRAIKILNWSETSPPMPADLIEINHGFRSCTPEEIAENLNGLLVEAIS